MQKLVTGTVHDVCEIQVLLTVVKLVRYKLKTLSPQLSALPMRLFWEDLYFLLAIFCCWSSDEVR